MSGGGNPFSSHHGPQLPSRKILELLRREIRRLVTGYDDPGPRTFPEFPLETQDVEDLLAA